MQRIADNKILSARRKVLLGRQERLRQIYKSIIVKSADDPNLVLRLKCSKIIRNCGQLISEIKLELGESKPVKTQSRSSIHSKRMRKAMRIFFNGELPKHCETDPNLPAILKGNKAIRELPFNDLYSTYAEHDRLIVFAQKGLKCVHPNCDQVASRLVVTMDQSGTYHVDVYTHDLKLMNVDHIIPKSKGGGEELTNKQPMCEYHNSKKGNQIIFYNHEQQDSSTMVG